MNKVREIGITIRNVRYALGYWWQPKDSMFNTLECWRHGKRSPRYLSFGVSLWRLALEFSAIERRAA